MRRFAFLATVSVLAMTASAGASDLPSKKSPAAVAPQQSSTTGWAGCYIGANGGFASQSVDTEYSGSDLGTNTGSGGLIGGQLGCDYQSGKVVFGVQGMVDFSNASGHNEYSDNEGGMLTTDAQWFGTVTGRLGYVIEPSTLIYAKGGLAWVSNDYKDDNNFWGLSTNQATSTGWTVGAGVEYKMSRSLSVFAEYSHLGFGSNTVELTGSNNWSNSYSEHVNIGTFGVNYRF